MRTAVSMDAEDLDSQLATAFDVSETPVQNAPLALPEPDRDWWL